MDMRKIEAQAKFLAPVVAAEVNKAVAALTAQLQQRDILIAELAKRLDNLPEPQTIDYDAIASRVTVPEPIPGEPGRDAEPVDVEAVAKAAADLIRLPEPIPGEPGKDAPTVDLEALAKSAAALIPAPEVDLKTVADLVPVPEVDLAAIAAMVKIPEPEPVDVEAIARAAAALVPVPAVREPEHGRDALDLELLPTIDEEKQYPRGTYATHRGGLWKSYERTHGMRGWECIVDGVDTVAIQQDGTREFSVALRKSSGAEVVEKFRIPVPVYKGVFREGDTYEENDNVTWAGSQWACSQTTSEKPGEGSKSWTLAVKRGRDGKDLRENASTFDPTKGVKLK